MAKKYVYEFREADHRNKKLFGGKGASLIQMTKLGLRVPPGFIITTEACKDFFTPRRAEIEELEALLMKQPPPEVRDAAIKKLFSIIDSLDMPPGLWDSVVEYMHRLEAEAGRKFGDPENPLLVSVRSGAAVSMPGMMDTVLNLGLNDQTVKGLAKQTGNEWFAYDAYRRFVNMFGRIVLGIDDKLFSGVWEEIKRKYGAKEDPEVPVEGLKEAVERFKAIIREQYGEFPQDPWEQLRLAIKAVFRSWDNPRSIFYRAANKITPDVADCTAVNVVTMVFGNMGWDSGTGVVFSRDVATGENKLYGEFLPVAQGEDVVAGIRTPMDIEEFRKRFPHLYDELYRGVKLLEKENKDVQDVEFTVERGKLYFLQCRNAKMTPLARVKTAVDMAKEGVISKDEAILKVSPDHVLQLLYPRIDPKANAKPVAKGLPASPGAVSGQLVFHPDDAVKWAREGKKVLLARVETKPDDVHGFYAAVGILTSRGGMTSHAAVVARAIGKPAVVGAESIEIDEAGKALRVNGQVLREGDWVTIDGNTGNVYIGVVPTVEPELIPELDELLKWADEVRRLGVRANADQPDDAAIARKFGAKGIGLLRIERMFRRPERLELLRKVILAENKEERIKHLEPLYKMLKGDFKEIFKVMDGLPVIVRLIDPPLHEFLPKPEEVLQQIYEAKAGGRDVKELEWLYNRVKALQEANPMLGHRGVRVGVTYPEFYYYLSKAILEAAAELKREGHNPIVEIMIPQVSDVVEIRYVKEHGILPALSDVEKEFGVRLSVKIGTMVETVRACLTMDKIAKEVDFISFGTNDLTQAVFSFSRDDAENKFIPQYLELKILNADPFETLDVEGVGKLVELAAKTAKEVNPDIEVGVCGEHGGDPKSIFFFHKTAVDYVSASPFRVPLARLAAAQAQILEKLGGKGPEAE
ncbi:MAG: pyruvate, phosphate dikinase [Thermoproteus sp. AZ2]|jgi:pyruvate,orthophosphate dikinase|uniref:Pyruvate, phosphate dikinase n=1 Tax=Thermoproteus sp. AZ2 TaxID=1609232 RepID=A0ACC6V3K5_9CREN